MKFLQGFVLFLGLWATSVPLAQAVITPVGPFTGTISETWESFPNYKSGPNSVNYLHDPTTIFGGNASISNPLMAVYEPGTQATFGLQSSGDAKVADGAKGMGVDGAFQTTTITFASAVSVFGGYWGAATMGLDAQQVTLSFLDVGGVSLGTDNFLYNHISTDKGALDWHGWMSTDGLIKSLTYSGNFVVNDGLQANTIPEPEIYAMMGIGLALMGFVARRKKLKEGATA